MVPRRRERRKGGRRKEERRINDAGSASRAPPHKRQDKADRTTFPLRPRIIKPALASLVWITAPNVDECTDGRTGAGGAFSGSSCIRVSEELACDPFVRRKTMKEDFNFTIVFVRLHSQSVQVARGCDRRRRKQKIEAQRVMS